MAVKTYPTFRCMALNSESVGMTRKLDLTGKVFARLTVLSESGLDHKGRSLWLVRCECGVERDVLSAKLQSGAAKSCGCLAREWRANFREVALRCNSTHGLSRTPTHESWGAMMQRCTNKKHVAYKRYGGAGIGVCERWAKSFAAFVEDMGIRPDGCSIDRIDNAKGYEKSNCRWATMKEQQRNKRGVVLNEVLASQIRWLRSDGGFTNQQVSDAFGIRRSHVSAITMGKIWKTEGRPG